MPTPEFQKIGKIDVCIYNKTYVDLGFQFSLDIIFHEYKSG